MDTATRAILALVGSVMSLAILSVIISKNANTAGVISAASGGLSQLIGAAEAPVTGGGGGAGSLFNPSFMGQGSLLGGFNSFLPGLGG